MGHPFAHFPENAFAASFGCLVAIYFWWKNTQGIHESSQKAVQIMIITTVMVVILIIWCTITVLRVPVQMPPSPFAPGIVPLNSESLGWLTNTSIPHLASGSALLTFIIVFVGFGHSVLAMSGEETLAQVNREIAHPKLKNLEKTGLVIFVYSLLFTSLVSFFAVMIIPDSVRPEYFGNLIGGIAVYLVGPEWAKLLFHGFVVLVGVLILSGAQNTSIVGANGVLNRVAEDGVLTSAFQKPHPRLRNQLPDHQSDCRPAIADDHSHQGKRFHPGRPVRVWRDLELRHDVAGGAGASPQGTRRPAMEGSRQSSISGSVKSRSGVIIVSAVLFTTAIVNLLTKKQATIGGVAFSALFFVDLHVLRTPSRARTSGQAGEPRPVPRLRQSGTGQRSDGRACRATFWLQCATHAISITCATFSATRIRTSRTLW